MCDPWQPTVLGQRDRSWFSTDKIWLKGFLRKTGTKGDLEQPVQVAQTVNADHPWGAMDLFPHHLLLKGNDMEVTEGRILELENLLDFQNAKIGKLEYRIERLERLVAVLMEANKITGGETKSATLN